MVIGLHDYFLFQFIGVLQTQASAATYRLGMLLLDVGRVAGNWAPYRYSLLPRMTSLSLMVIFLHYVPLLLLPTQFIGQPARNGRTVLGQCVGYINGRHIGCLQPCYISRNGSQLILGRTKSITLSLNTAYVGGTWSVGTVNGDIILAQTANVSMLLTSLTTNGLVFTSGASFQDAPSGVNVGTDAFSGSTIGGVLFQSGANMYLAGTKTAYSIGTVADIFQYANAFKTPTTDVNLQSGSTCYIWNPYPYSTPGNGGTLGNSTHRIPDFPITNSRVSVAGECWKRNYCCVK